MTEETEYRGMTPNERLVIAGTRRRFVEAIRLDDRTTAISLLQAVEVDSAETIVDQVLAEPTRYGRLKVQKA